MATVTTVSDAYNLVLPGNQKVQMLYPDLPAEYKEFCEVFSSERSQEWTIQVRGLGVARLKPEGQDTYVDGFQQKYQKTFKNRTYALAAILTEELLDDNLYEEAFPRMTVSLQRAMLTTENIEGASVINEGYNPQFPGWDGLPLFSTAHPIDGGVQANTFTTLVPLTEASLEQAISGINTFRDPAGILIGNSVAKKLIVPPSMIWQACRLLDSQFRTGTATNDINALYTMQAIKEGYAVNHYINPNLWFIRTSNPGIKKFERRKFTLNAQPNFSQLTLLNQASARFCFGFDDWRAVFGGQVPLVAAA